MLTSADKTPKPRRASTSNDVRPTRTPAQSAAVRRAKRHLNAKLAIDAPELPKSAKAAIARALESAMDELIADLPPVNRGSTTIGRAAQVEAKGAKDSSVTPTDALRQAMVEADRIERGRFADADELFGSIGQR